ncbi:uncharacterized protein TNCV_2581871 [Trichonephila clavipes]|nr:uncharacterized protein TNCV_2581871 [Trichonephila clavipes]
MQQIKEDRETPVNLRSDSLNLLHGHFSHPLDGECSGSAHDPPDFNHNSIDARRHSRTLISTPTPYLVKELNLHWCAKIKDEVEKLAYKLNEEAERTERPIRRLSKVMYGSTCADMQVDVMGECLSSIKHVVGVRSVFLAKRLHRRIAVKITPSCCLSEKWRIINLLDDIGMLLPEVESLGEVGGRPQCDKPEETGAGEIARHTTQATGRPISRFTVARRLHGGGLFARCPVRCVPLTPAHRREGVLCGAGNTGIGETMNGDEYSLQMRADSV